MRAAQKGLKMSCIHHLGTTTGLGSFLDFDGFDPFFSHLWAQICPFSRPFAAKMACSGLKKGSFHLFVHPKWSRIIFGKIHS